MQFTVHNGASNFDDGVRAVGRRRDPLPVLADRRRSGGAAAHDTPRDLRDDRAPSAARRHPHSPTRPVSRGRPATLAGPEARAIAGGVNGDERHTTTVSKRGLGSGHHHPASRRQSISRAETRVPLLEIGGAAMGGGSRAVPAAARPAGHAQGGAHTGSVRAEIRRRSRAGEPSQAERDCLHRIDPEMASGSHARSEASRRDHATNRCSG